MDTQRKRSAPRPTFKNQFISSHANRYKGSKNKRYTKSSAVKYLESLADQAARKRYPSVPYIAPRKYRDDTANGLTKCIIDFLQLSGHQAERISNTGRFLDNRKSFINALGQDRTVGSRKWIPGTGTNGTADISQPFMADRLKLRSRSGMINKAKTKRLINVRLKRPEVFMR